jgi:hypothetical protein
MIINDPSRIINFPHRFVIVSEPHGLVASVDTQEEAEDIALRAAVNTARTVYVEDLQEIK